MSVKYHKNMKLFLEILFIGRETITDLGVYIEGLCFLERRRRFEK